MNLLSRTLWGRGLTSLRLIVVLVLYPVLPASAGSDWLPGEKHYLAALEGRDCAIYRSVENKTRLAIGEAERQMAGEIETLKKRRGELEECARKRGIENLGSSQTEVLAAELCSEAYEAWLSPSYRVQMHRQDLLEAEDSLRTLARHLQSHCTILPASLPPDGRVATERF